MHAHTLASDGRLPPRELVAAAAAAGLGALAVTDHDTLDGVPEALEAGRRLGVRVVPGVELSVRAPSGSMHLLGYFAEPAPEPLAGRLAELRRLRLVRAERMVERLAALGAPVRLADVAARARGPVGRPHVADALVAAGHAADRQDAFDRFLADGRPGWVPHEGLEAAEAVRLVRDSGGAPVLAHPASLAMSPGGLDAFVQRLRAAGLRGIEVHRPDHTPALHDLCARIAHRHGLVPCGGSDFHGPDGVARLGDTGAPPLPAATLERLLGDRDRAGHG